MNPADDAAPETPPGPLSGFTVLEVGGIGPLPLFGMLVSDLGARVIRIDRIESGGPRIDPEIWMYRGRESVTVDLGNDRGRDVLLRLVDDADVLVEGFRAGVAERLGFGPDVCLARQPRLVYGRMTGWGGYGPLAAKGGHDLNYLAISGALAAIGPRGAPPAVPLNLIGDYGGGTMMLTLGVLAALTETQRSGRGQVVEAAMSDGVLALMAQWFSMRAAGGWIDERESNLTDGGAPYYRCYETRDGKYVAVAAIESKFYGELIDGLGLDPALAVTQRDRSTWPELHTLFSTTIASCTRDEWEATFAERDACLTPVLTMAEALEYPHNVERRSIITANGQVQVAPPVRFQRTPATVGRTAPVPGADTQAVLTEHGFSPAEVEGLRVDKVIG